jgi:hypothetical protein
MSPSMSSEVIGSYRYVTPVLKGRWHASRDEALAEALAAGQAYVRSGEVQLFAFTHIEERVSQAAPLRRQSGA